MRIGRKGWLGVLVAGVLLLAGLLVNSGLGGDQSSGQRGGSQGAGSQRDSRSTSTKSSDKKSGDRGTDPETGLSWIEEADLPEQGRQTLSLIDRGGPYPYDKDGSTFGNFEGVLPKQSRGFYAEYTVKTPGEGDRGARRIVTGGKGKQLQYFWTDDHYESFARIRR